WRRDVEALLPGGSADLYWGRPRIGESARRRPAHRRSHRLGDRPRRLALALPGTGRRAMDFLRRGRHVAEVRRPARPGAADLDRRAFAARRPDALPRRAGRALHPADIDLLRIARCGLADAN